MGRGGEEVDTFRRCKNWVEKGGGGREYRVNKKLRHERMKRGRWFETFKRCRN